MKRDHLLLLILLLAACAPMRAQQKTVIIANRSANVDQITMSDLRGIFLGETSRYHNGSPAVPVVMRSGPEHDFFLAEYIGRVDSSFRSVWRSLVFTGQSNMPHNAEDDAAMVAYVARTPGAIGYVMKAAPHDGVTTVTVK